MPSKKIPISTQTPENPVEFTGDLSDTSKNWYIWLKISFTGTIIAIFLVIVSLIMALIANFFNFGILLLLYNNGLLLVFMSAFYFMSSGLSIWFGPSPQWADLKSRMLRMTIKPKNMSSSLQNGFKHFVTATVLLLMSN